MEVEDSAEWEREPFWDDGQGENVPEGKVEPVISQADAKDGFPILEVETGRKSNLNPLLVNRLGSSRALMVKKTVGEARFFKELASNQEMVERLREQSMLVEARGARP
jgi:hypothetical protein